MITPPFNGIIFKNKGIKKLKCWVRNKRGIGLKADASFIARNVGSWFWIIILVLVNQHNTVRSVQKKRHKKLKMNIIEELGQTSSFLIIFLLLEKIIPTRETQ